MVDFNRQHPDFEDRSQEPSLERADASPSGTSLKRVTKTVAWVAGVSAALFAGIKGGTWLAQNQGVEEKRSDDTAEREDVLFDTMVLGERGLHDMKARVHKKRGRFDQALEECTMALEQAKQQSRPAFDMLLLKADLLKSLNRIPEAIVLLEEEARTMKVRIQPEPYGTLSRLYEKLPDAAKAKRYAAVYQRIQDGERDEVLLKEIDALLKR